MAHFIIAVLNRWTRHGESTVQTEPRPHVVPVSPEAVSFMDAYMDPHSGRKAGQTVYGGFTDAVSVIDYDGQERLAFRFQTLSPAQGKEAVQVAEEALAEGILAITVTI